MSLSMLTMRVCLLWQPEAKSILRQLAQAVAHLHVPAG